MKGLMIFILYFAALLCNAQTLQEQADALESQLSNMSAVEKVSAYNQLAEYYMGIKDSQVIHYLELAEKSAKENHLIKQEAKSYLLKGQLRYIQSRNDEAIHFGQKAVIEATKGKDTLILVQAYELLSSIYILYSDLETAETYYDSLTSLVGKNDDSLLIAHDLFSYGEILALKGEFADAIKALNTSLSLFKELNLDQQIIEVLYSLGVLYYENYFYNQGLIYFEYAVQIAERIGNVVELSYSYNFIANSYLSQGDYETALENYQKATYYSELSESIDVLIVLYSNMASCYIELEDFKKGLDCLHMAEELQDKGKNYYFKPYLVGNYAHLKYKQKDYRKAIYYFKESIPLLRKSKDFPFIVSKFLLLAECYYLEKDTSMALTYYDSAKILTDKLGKISLSQLYHESYHKFAKLYGYTNEALFHLEKYTQLRDSSEMLSSHEKLIFETDILEGAIQKENISLKRSVEQKQDKVFKLQLVIYLLVALGFSVVLVIIAIYRIRSHRKLKEVNIQLAEMVDVSTRDLKEEIKQKAIIEEELLEINDRFEKLTRSIPDITWSSRLNNDGTNTLVYLSPQIQAYSNYKVDDFKMKPEIWVHEIVHPEDREQVLKTNMDVNSGELSVAEIEYRIIDKNESVKWIHEKINVSREIDGVRLDAIISDITKQKEIEIKLRESQEKLQELNATKDKFFSIIAHDLKNPFNSILGFANLLKENYDEYHKNEHMVFIENIRNASDSAYKLLQNLLEWSRSQTGRLEVKPETFDLSEVVNNNIALLNPLAHNKQIHLATTVAFDTLVFADKNMIHTIVRNLIQNAIKFSYPDQEVGVFAEMGEQFVYLSIADSGVGISEDKLDKLFRIETQIKTKGTAKEQGTGLGLMLCKEFIEKNCGEIQVESKPGHGSTFTISIPMYELNA